MGGTEGEQSFNTFSKTKHNVTKKWSLFSTTNQPVLFFDVNLWSGKKKNSDKTRIARQSSLTARWCTDRWGRGQRGKKRPANRMEGRAGKVTRVRSTSNRR